MKKFISSVSQFSSSALSAPLNLASNLSGFFSSSYFPGINLLIETDLLDRSFANQFFNKATTEEKNAMNAIGNLYKEQLEEVLNAKKLADQLEHDVAEKDREALHVNLHSAHAELFNNLPKAIISQVHLLCNNVLQNAVEEFKYEGDDIVIAPGGPQ